MKGPLVALGLLVAGSAAAGAVDPEISLARQEGRYYVEPSEYDGMFQFARLRFSGRGGSRGFRRRGWGRDEGWAHDLYDGAEYQLTTIIKEISTTPAEPGHNVVVELGDPDLFRYPILYVSEPGNWYPTEEEVEALRAYLLKGGFIIFDDFHFYEMENVAIQMGRALPDHQWFRLDGTEPVYHTFFDILDPIAIVPSYGKQGPLTYFGLYEDNDPAHRLIAIANAGNDVGDWWEYNPRGYLPVDIENEAFKLGVNYIIYGLLH